MSGGIDVSEKCYSSDESSLFYDLADRNLDTDTAVGLPVLKDWLENGGNFDRDADESSAYAEGALEVLKVSAPSVTILQSASLTVNRGPRCQHHGYRLSPQVE